ncbi:MAG: hypothetical protein J3K34DRAFT_434683 [Monoraphidium minutum]|nr:MAG: hypothetical protein J3K34DRAFT_434683 [Monoraphidium minutum]
MGVLLPPAATCGDRASGHFLLQTATTAPLLLPHCKPATPLPKPHLRPADGAKTRALPPKGAAGLRALVASVEINGRNMLGMIGSGDTMEIDAKHAVHFPEATHKDDATDGGGKGTRRTGVYLESEDTWHLDFKLSLKAGNGIKAMHGLLGCGGAQKGLGAAAGVWGGMGGLAYSCAHGIEGAPVLRAASAAKQPPTAGRPHAPRPAPVRASRQSLHWKPTTKAVVEGGDDLAYIVADGLLGTEFKYSLFGKPTSSNRRALMALPASAIVQAGTPAAVVSSD